MFCISIENVMASFAGSVTTVMEFLEQFKSRLIWLKGV